MNETEPLPLYNPAAAPDGWHNVRAPGGYEWWYFDADDAENDVHIVAIFMEGFIFHPGYLRRHHAWAARPHRRTPVLPGDFPCAYFVVYEKGKIASQFMTQYAPSQFKASPDGPEVSIGDNTLRRDGASLELSLTGTPWHLTFRGPQLLDETLSASLRFTPTVNHDPIERIFLSREMTGAEHHWVIANPLCEVSGEIKSGSRSWPFKGRGYHDHNYGTGPINAGLRDWTWGRLLGEDSVATFHYARPRDTRLPPETHLVTADGAGVRELEVDNVSAVWNKRSSTGLAYPSRLQIGDLQISAPRVVDSSPFYLRVVYEGEMAGNRALKGKLLCEVAHPHRLLWPVLGRMIEMSIDKRELQSARTETASR